MSEAKPIIGHLIELRKRLIWVVATMTIGTIVCFGFVPEIYGFLVTPLAEAMGQGDNQRLIATDLTEPFFVHLKVAFFAGVFLTFPILLLQIWLFVAPGLYEKEKMAFLPFFIATPILFFAGGALVYYLVMPMAWAFFLGFQTSEAQTVLAIEVEQKVSEYLSLIMSFFFAFGLCFQLPVLLTLLGRAGMISSQWLVSKRKYAFIVSFIVAAFLTPADPVSMFVLALPLYLLYEISIFLVRYAQPKNTQADLPDAP